eukprot:GILK01009815.1.p1 GENE.GILK01009815.1~~GILK01009815.1.p1  ORF type:complete len:205 (-),score=26.19 GILK01009815.1:235-849(-)
MAASVSVPRLTGKRIAVWTTIVLIVGIILICVGGASGGTKCPSGCRQRKCVSVSYQSFECDCGSYCSDSNLSMGPALIVGIIMVVFSTFGYIAAIFKAVYDAKKEQEAQAKPAQPKAEVPVSTPNMPAAQQQVAMTQYPVMHMAPVAQPVPTAASAYPVSGGALFPAQYPSQTAASMPAQGGAQTMMVDINGVPTMVSVVSTQL